MVSSELDMTAPATLVVVWRSGQRAVGRAVKAGGDVMEALRGYAGSALEKVRTGTGRPYDPNDEQGDEDAYLATDRDELLDTALLEQILTAASLPQATEQELKEKKLALYALVVGKDPNKLTTFVRRGNPVSLASKGVLATFDRTLTRVTSPLLAFDRYYDLIIYPQGVHILDQVKFEALFKESEAVLAKTTEWAESLGEKLPITSDGIEWLADRLRKTSILRRKVQGILRSDYLAQLTPDVLRDKITAHGLDAKQLMPDGQLVINKETEQDVLLLLNEDLWTGDFSGKQYAAGRKSPRQT